MAASLQIEAETVLSQNWRETFFQVQWGRARKCQLKISVPLQKRPTDFRYERVKFMKYSTFNSIVGDTGLVFQLPKFSQPNVYLPHDMLLQIDIKISLEDNKAIPATTVVAPVNNILHSLFKTCRYNHSHNNFCDYIANKYFSEYISMKLLSRESQKITTTSPTLSTCWAIVPKPKTPSCKHRVFTRIISS